LVLPVVWDAKKGFATATGPVKAGSLGAAVRWRRGIRRPPTFIARGDGSSLSAIRPSGGLSLSPAFRRKEQTCRTRRAIAIRRASPSEKHLYRPPQSSVLSFEGTGLKYD
jgi:hypothetical protein